MTDAELMITTIEGAIAQYRAAQAPPPPLFHLVLPGEDLQAALDSATLPVRLVGAGNYPGVIIRRSVELDCQGAHLHGEGTPAVEIRASDVTVIDPLHSSTFQASIQIGANDGTQTSLEQVPRRIRLIRPVLLSHCGAQAKNGIENNGAFVTIIEPTVLDVFSPGLAAEAHGIVTINTPGGLTVIGGTVCAGATPLFTGGDAIDIPDTDIADITYDGVTITRPAAWQAEGTAKGCKNLVEFKNVTRGKVTRCTLTNNWGPVQKGFACMLTPKVDGRVVDVEFSDNVIDRVGGGWNILGRNPTGADPTRTDDIRILRNVVTIDKVAYGPGAFGWPFLLSAGPGRILIEGNTIVHNGNSFVYVDDLQRIASLIIRGNTANVGAYGIRTPAGNNGTNWSQVFDELIVEGNIFTGASSVFRANFPNNDYR